MAEMTTAQRDAFLREPRIAILSTLMAGGAPAAVPIWYDWDGSRARMFTGRRSPKVTRIQRDPRVSLTVAEPVHVPEAWVSIEGTGTLEEGTGFELAQLLAPRYYSAEHAKQVLVEWETMTEHWVTIVVEPIRIRTSIG